MGLKSILKEKAMWKKKLGLSDTGKVIFDSPIEIKCMIEDKVKLTVTSTGEQFLNYSMVLTVEPVGLGDELNDRPVVAVNKIKNGRGQVMGFEVYLT